MLVAYKKAWVVDILVSQVPCMLPLEVVVCMLVVLGVGCMFEVWEVDCMFGAWELACNIPLVALMPYILVALVCCMLVAYRQAWVVVHSWVLVDCKA